MTYQQLKDKERMAFILAQSYAREAEEAKKNEITHKGIEGWIDYDFQSSSGLTEEFAEFAKQLKKELAKRLTGYTIVSFNRGHFYVSLFAKNNETNRLVYISCDDVRGRSNGWYNNLLIRTAKHEKDYTGGCNEYSSIEKIKEQANYLTRYDVQH